MIARGWTATATAKAFIEIREDPSRKAIPSTAQFAISPRPTLAYGFKPQPAFPGSAGDGGRGGMVSYPPGTVTSSDAKLRNAHRLVPICRGRRDCCS